MADIVETLRHLADAVEAQQAPHNYVLHLRAGADEIARLRAGGCARDQGTTQYCAEAAKLAAENERLRAALREIVSLDDEPKCCGKGIAGYDSPPECCGDPERGIDRAQSVARAALEGK